MNDARRAVDLIGGIGVVLVDGPAGSGKTTFAAAVRNLTGAPTVHLDDLYEGWDGMAAGLAQAQVLLDARVAGAPMSYPRYDWHRSSYAEDVEVPPAPLLVVEGCGAGSLRADDAVVVWVEAAPEVRLARGVARDGEGMREHWLRWQSEEAELFARDRTRERAEIRLVT